MDFAALRVRPSFFAQALGAAAAVVALTATSDAAAEEAPREAPIAPSQIQSEARAYYDSEMTSAFLFMGFGAVTAGGGAVELAQSGDFAHGFGGSSLVLGSLTALGGAGYGVAVKIRGDYYTGLSRTDLARYQREEADHIRGTNGRFWLYLGSELAETAAGIGIAAYGLAAKNELYRGIGIGAAIQGIGLFVIDVPGAGRAARYQEDVRRFDPRVGFSVGGGGRPWSATLAQRF